MMGESKANRKNNKQLVGKKGKGKPDQFGPEPTGLPEERKD